MQHRNKTTECDTIASENETKLAIYKQKFNQYVKFLYTQ